MSSGNVIAINGQYTIKYINISGEEVALTSQPIDAKESAIPFPIPLLPAVTNAFFILKLHHHMHFYMCLYFQLVLQ